MAKKKQKVAEQQAYLREYDGRRYYYKEGHGSQVFTPERLREMFPDGKLVLLKAPKADDRAFLFVPTRYPREEESRWGMTAKVVEIEGRPTRYVPFIIAFGTEVPKVDAREGYYYEEVRSDTPRR